MMSLNRNVLSYCDTLRYPNVNMTCNNYTAGQYLWLLVMCYVSLNNDNFFLCKANKKCIIINALQA